MIAVEAFAAFLLKLAKIRSKLGAFAVTKLSTVAHGLIFLDRFEFGDPQLSRLASGLAEESAGSPRFPLEDHVPIP